MGNTPKPLVTIATACEKVLMEKDGVASIIRVVDTFYIHEDIAKIDAKAMVQASAFVAVKAGDFLGKTEFSLVLRGPDGKSVNHPEKLPAEFTRSEQGVNININFLLPAKKLGLYWVDIVWQAEVLTSFPIKLVQQIEQSSADPKNLP